MDDILANISSNNTPCVFAALNRHELSIYQNVLRIASLESFGKRALLRETITPFGFGLSKLVSYKLNLDQKWQNITGFHLKPYLPTTPPAGGFVGRSKCGTYKLCVQREVG
jgi:hypothetical protein